MTIRNLVARRHGIEIRIAESLPASETRDAGAVLAVAKMPR
jgi:hypothetical protein